jgi:excinuclease UvrABC nuclease subunit
MVELAWSEWLDFNGDGVSKVPESPGVYMMHAAMKILFIGDSNNLRQSISESLKAPCIGEAKRFRYFVTNSHAEIKITLITEYQEKHEGKLPKCMDSN